jgi:xanthine dehydrogenase accessory factor
MRPAILVLGAGDMGSAVAHALHEAGWAVAIRDDPAPAHPRRGMAFADALWDGRAELAGVGAMRVDTGAALRDALADGRAIAVTALSLDAVLAAQDFAAAIDARMRKRSTPPDRRGLAALVLGLGPGFVAGGNCHLAVETSWEAPGRLIEAGPTLPLRGEPRAIAGVGREPAVYAPAGGVLRTARRIGERVTAGEAVATIDGIVLRAPVGGCLRGLVRDNVTVTKDAKVLEVDPRGDPALCFGIGERPRLVAAAVAEVLAARLPAAPESMAARSVVGAHP